MLLFAITHGPQDCFLRQETTEQHGKDHEDALARFRWDHPQANVLSILPTDGVQFDEPWSAASEEWSKL